MEHFNWLNAQSLTLWFYTKFVVKIFNNDIIAKILGFFVEKECSSNEDPTSFNQHTHTIFAITWEGMGGRFPFFILGSSWCKKVP
jgi:hypothetical protein